MVSFATSFTLLTILGCASCSIVADVPPYTEHFTTQFVDHFNVGFNKTFQQRFLVCDTWWRKGNGPIFFYSGNEGDITVFWENLGFPMDIAPEFGALIVYAEHRFYGKSLPFGEMSFTMPFISYLTIEQAIADFGILLTNYKQEINCTKCPVISFGGSYGGMLSAYMRFKYPNIVTGAIASSAPIYLLTTDLDRTFFYFDITREYESLSPQAVYNVKNAFQTMKEVAASGSKGLAELSSAFHLCEQMTNIAEFKLLEGWMRNAFAQISMFNYPFATDFLGALPANPVNVSINYLTNTTDLIGAMAKVVGMFYNGTSGHLKCFDYKSQYVPCADPSGCGTGTDSSAWDYLACTEIHLTDGTDGVIDMFPDLPFNETMREKYCLAMWQVTPRNKWSSIQFWGYDIATASNIVFSNGDLDPWHRGGVLHDIGKGITAIIIKGGAHVYDLFYSNPADLQSVKLAREAHIGHINKWLGHVRP